MGFARDNSRPPVDSVFPFDEPRVGQMEALSEASEHLYASDSVDVVILDLPTGSGKSPINTALCRQARNAFYTTPQKSLRKQLDEDDVLTDYLATLRARTDYSCLADQGASCADCSINQSREQSCIDHSAVAQKRPAMADETCRYWDAKKRAMDAHTALLTFAYLIIDNRLPVMIDRIPEGSDGPAEPTRISFDDRELLVVDEAHSLEGHVASLHVGFTVNGGSLTPPVRNTLRDDIDTANLDVDKPTIDVIEGPLTEAAAIATYHLDYYVLGDRDIPDDLNEGDHPPNPREWLSRMAAGAGYAGSEPDYMRAIARNTRPRIGGTPEAEIATLSDDGADAGAENFLPNWVRHAENFTRRVAQILDSGANPDDDGVWVVGDESSSEHPADLRLSFQPVDVAPFLARNVWSRAEKIVLSTATMPYRDDPRSWLDRIGLGGASFAVVSQGMRFPAENRPIHTDLTVGELSGGGFGGHREAIFDTVAHILDEHPREKGLIHTVSYNRADSLADGLRVRGYGDRVVMHRREPNAPDAEDQLDAWKRTPADDGQVFLSPSSTEGVDLPGDHCRFQVLLKVPLPYLGDPRVRYLASGQGDWEWYKEEAFLAVAQSVGRGVRNDTDVCEYYVLDANLNTSWKSLLSSVTAPEWFLGSLESGRS